MDDTARLRWTILGVLIAVALASSLAGVLLLGQTWGALCLNIGTEMAGAAATYYLLERVIGRRERQEAEERALEEKKATLIARMGSGVSDVAIAAAEELQRHGWLYAGSLSLQGANLMQANLSGAVLSEADLSGANLSGADLSGADLSGANLSKADLGEADLGEAELRRANLSEADLHEADLGWADLRGTDLSEADLREADLRWADLSGADLGRAKLRGATCAGPT